MNNWTWFLLGLWLGGSMGFVTFALMHMAKSDSSDKSEAHKNEGC